MNKRIKHMLEHIAEENGVSVKELTDTSHYPRHISRARHQAIIALHKNFKELSISEITNILGYSDRKGVRDVIYRHNISEKKKASTIIARIVAFFSKIRRRVAG